MGAFRIHPRLVDDCHRLGRLTCAHLLLHRNATLHWFILVPETDATDLLDLARAERVAVMDDAASVSRFLKQDLGYPKVNVGAIGNLVPQLHVHVIGRKPGDTCWPAPVWGNLGDSPGYRDDEIDGLRRRLNAACELRCVSGDG